MDDAIVVVENVERHIGRGLKPREAAFTAMDEVGGPVIAIAVVLCAVFIPTAFISGISGAFYKQFALTIAGATIISAFNSLTLTPAMCALILKPHGERQGWFATVWNFSLGWFFRLFNKMFDAGSNAYASVVRRSARLAIVIVLIYGGLLLLTGQMFRVVSTGFVPASDQGYIIMAIQLPDGSSLERTDAVVRKVIRRIIDVPGSQKVIGFAGLSGATQTNATNAGVVYMSFLSFIERDKHGWDQKEIMGEVTRRLADMKEASIFVIPPPTVPGLGTLGGFTFELQDRTGRGSAALASLAQDLATAANGDPRVSSVYTQFRASSPQLYADIDRTRAEMLGMPTQRVLEALQVNIGSEYVNDFNIFGRPFRVTAAADAGHRLEPSDIAKLRARSDKGAMVPLGSITTFRQVTGPEFVTRYNLFPSAEIYGDTGAGGSSTDAIGAMQSLAKKSLPQGYGSTWTGLYYQQILAGNTAPLHLPALRAVRLPVIGRVVRKLVAAAGDHPDRAHVLAVRDHRRLVPRDGQQRADADRLRGARGAGVQERDPDRGVRQRGAGAARQGRHLRRRPSGAHSAAADSDDVLRIHPRRRSAGDQSRGRVRTPPGVGNGGVQRDARRHVLRAALHAGLLRRGPPAHRAGQTLGIAGNPPAGSERRTSPGQRFH